MTYRLAVDCQQKQEDWIMLTLPQQHYLKRVLRLNDGDRLIVMDGKGKEWLAQIRGKQAQIIEELRESNELPVNVTLMVALPKGNGFDDIVRSCTELGVSSFIPVISERTLLKPSLQKVQRWRRIVVEAAEQSERQIVPQIWEPVNWSEALTKVTEIDKQAYICVTRREVKHLFNYLQEPKLNHLVIATGPEGGWTNQEVEQAMIQGFIPVSLGARILRAVTAPMCVMSVVTASLEMNK